MFEQLTALGYGIVIFAVVVGVGAVILYNFAGSQACVGNVSGYIWNTTTNLCMNPLNTTNTSIPTSTAYTQLTYMNTQLGTTGLAGWTPAVIAIAIGMLFFGAFLIGRGKKGRY